MLPSKQYLFAKPHYARVTTARLLSKRAQVLDLPAVQKFLPLKTSSVLWIYDKIQQRREQTVERLKSYIKQQWERFPSPPQVLNAYWVLSKEKAKFKMSEYLQKTREFISLNIKYQIFVVHYIECRLKRISRWLYSVFIHVLHNVPTWLELGFAHWFLSLWPKVSKGCFWNITKVTGKWMFFISCFHSCVSAADYEAQDSSRHSGSPNVSHYTGLWAHTVGFACRGLTLRVLPLSLPPTNPTHHVWKAPVIQAARLRGTLASLESGIQTRGWHSRILLGRQICAKLRCRLCILSALHRGLTFLKLLAYDKLIWVLVKRSPSWSWDLICK